MGKARANVTLDSELLAEARAFELNVSAIAEGALEAAVKGGAGTSMVRGECRGDRRARPLDQGAWDAVARLSDLEAIEACSSTPIGCPAGDWFSTCKRMFCPTFRVDSSLRWSLNERVSGRSPFSSRSLR